LSREKNFFAKGMESITVNRREGYQPGTGLHQQTKISLGGLRLGPGVKREGGKDIRIGTRVSGKCWIAASGGPRTSPPRKGEEPSARGKKEQKRDKGED